jgi:hypothetical protein
MKKDREDHSVGWWQEDGVQRWLTMAKSTSIYQVIVELPFAIPSKHSNNLCHRTAWVSGTLWRSTGKRGIPGQGEHQEGARRNSTR